MTHRTMIAWPNEDAEHVQEKEQRKIEEQGSGAIDPSDRKSENSGPDP